LFLYSLYFFLFPQFCIFFWLTKEHLLKIPECSCLAKVIVKDIPDRCYLTPDCRKFKISTIIQQIIDASSLWSMKRYSSFFVWVIQWGLNRYIKLCMTLKMMLNTWLIIKVMKEIIFLWTSDHRIFYVN
jgi:hypothetical protein